MLAEPGVPVTLYYCPEHGLIRNPEHVGAGTWRCTNGLATASQCNKSLEPVDFVPAADPAPAPSPDGEAEARLERLRKWLVGMEGHVADVIRDPTSQEFSPQWVDRQIDGLLRIIEAPVPPAPDGEAEGSQLHRLRVTWNAGDSWPDVTIVCPPGNAGCEPGRCEECPESGRCVACQLAGRFGPCWIESWNGADENEIVGTVEIPVNVKASGTEGYPRFEIAGSPAPATGPEGEHMDGETAERLHGFTVEVDGEELAERIEELFSDRLSDFTEQGDGDWLHDLMIDVKKAVAADAARGDGEGLREAAEFVMGEMENRFMWAITTGPNHPDATTRKAVEAIIAPLLDRLAPALDRLEGEHA